MSRTKRISQIVMILIIGLAFGSGIASAEYLGPDRIYDVTTWETCDKGVWAHKAGYHECVSADGSWAEDCIDCTWVCDRGTACGSATYWYTTGTVAVEHTVTHTDPEATVAITPNCGVWGDASWCLQPSSVTITANEPVSGEQITLIEGTQNGDAFACAANTCTVNIMGEGSNAFTYWALSSYGDSSRMGTHTALQDTIAPEIDSSVTGTMGENGWFVSNATLSVAFSDATPGSGLVMTQALFNGVSTDVSSPVTITDGVYDIQLSTRDAAGWEAHGGGMIYVDTTAPVITANQPAVEVSNGDVTGGGYVNGSVVFTGTYSDATSGVSQVQVSPDGSNWFIATLNADGSWIYDWDSSQASDGSYTPLAYAVDNAGNRTDITLQPITLDNSAPAMSMTGSWYIWDSGHIVVFDNRVGIKQIELSVRDDQGRWPAREWEFDTSKLEMDLQWDRKFGDGTVAPTGSYEVLLQAWDKLGNGRWITSRIYIPEAGATAVIPLGDVVSGGNFEDTPTPMAEKTETEEGSVPPAAPASTEPAPTATLQPSSTPSSLNFSSAPIIPASGESKSTSLPVDPNLLTGAAALAAAASATAYSLQRKEEKEAERKRQEEQSRAEAMAKVRAAEATKVSNYLQKLANDKIQEEKAEFMALMARTGGRVYTDLSDDQKKEFLAQGAGAAAAVSDYFAPQIAESKRTAEQNAEWSRIIASTGGRAISDLSKEKFNEFLDQGLGAKMAASSYLIAQQAAYEAAMKEAREYSNQVKKFHEGEGASSQSYEEYKAYHDKLTRMEEATEDRNVITPNPKQETKTSPPMPGIAASMAGVDYSGKSLMTPTAEMMNGDKIELSDKPKEYPVLKWMKDRYMTIWDSFNSAKTISSSENATFWQKVFARNYMGGVVAIHLALAIGIGLLTWAGAGAAYTAIDTAIMTASINAIPTVAKITSIPVVAKALTNPSTLEFVGKGWDFFDSSLTAYAVKHGDAAAAGELQAQFQMDGVISAGEVIATTKYLGRSAPGMATEVYTEFSELASKYDDDLVNLIIDYRSDKLTGEISEGVENILDGFTDLAKFLKFSDEGAELLKYSDEIVDLNKYVSANDGSKFEIIKAESAEEVNKEWFARGYTEPPVLPNTTAYKVKLNNDEEFFRVFVIDTPSSKNNRVGGWLMRKEDINGLTPEEIQIKYALPDLPNHWTTVNLNAGDELRISITNQNFDLDGGAIQFDLLGQRIGLFGKENKIGNVLEIP